MKWFLWFVLVLGCGGAVEDAPDAAPDVAAWRCLPITSSGASLPCDDDGGVQCSCPTTCSCYGRQGFCTTR